MTAFAPGTVIINDDGTVNTKTGMAGYIYDEFVAGVTLPSPIESVDALKAAAASATQMATGICEEIINVPLEAGSILTRNSAAAQAVGAAYQQVTQFSEDGEAVGGITVDFANNKITVNDAGTYLIAWTASFKGSANRWFTTAIGVNGTENERLACRAEVEVAGATVNMGFTGLLALSAADVLTMRIKSSGAGNSFTGVFMNLTVQQLTQAAI